MKKEDNSEKKAAGKAAKHFLRSGSDPASLRKDIRRWLSGILWSFLLIPLLFYLRFGIVGPIGWGTTIFFAALCLLIAVGLHFLNRREYHTPVELKDDWADRIGSLWLLSCAVGPLIGWVLSSLFILSIANWQWLYCGRVFFSIVLPVVTALPLLRYVRGKGTAIMLAILLGVTALPIWSGWATLRDLYTGPVSYSLTHNPAIPPENGDVLYLQYTGKVLIEAENSIRLKK